MMNAKKLLLPLFVGLLCLGLIPAAAQAASPSKAKHVLRYAKQELRKGVKETRDNNLPKYRNGRLAPYAIPASKTTGLPWSVTFVSYLMDRAGYKGLGRAYGGMKTASGKVLISHVDALSSWARKTKRISSTPAPGYLAVYGSSHVAVVERVRRNKVTATIGGNTRDRVARTVGSKANSGISFFIKL